MWKIIVALVALASVFSVKECVAISEHELVSADENVWEALDELEPGRNYIVLFNTLGDEVPENDKIIRVWG